MRLAAWILLLGVLRNYAPALFAIQHQGMASKGLGAVLVLGLMWLLWGRAKSRPVAIVMIWLAWEQLQIVICSAWWIYDPWVVPEGMSVCHAKTGFDIGAIGILAISIISWNLLYPNNHESTTTTQR